MLGARAGRQHAVAVEQQVGGKGKGDCVGAQQPQLAACRKGLELPVDVVRIGRCGFFTKQAQQHCAIGAVAFAG